MNKLSYLCLLSFASLSHVSMAATIYDPGIAYCQGNPSFCGLESGGAYNNGKQQCISDPASCGISSGGITQDQLNIAVATATQTGIQSGRNECISNPTACGISGGTGIYTQAQYDAAVATAIQTGTQSGRNECIVNPAACGISSGGITQDQLNTAVATATQTGIQLGRNECISNPVSCNLLTYTQEQLISFTKQIKDAAKTECQENPAFCSLFNQTQLDQKANAAKLQLDMSDGQFISNNGKILKATFYVPSFNAILQVTPEIALFPKLVLNNEEGKEPYMFQLIFPTTPSQEQSGTGTQNTTSSTTQTIVK